MKRVFVCTTCRRSYPYRPGPSGDCCHGAIEVEPASVRKDAQGRVVDCQALAVTKGRSDRG